MAREVRFLLCGFGRVGRGFARLLAGKREKLRAGYGLDLRLAGVGELMGSLHRPAGLDPGAAADFFEAHKGFGGHPALQAGWKGLDLIGRAEAELLVEATPTDIRTGEPALGHIRAALAKGMHVVSA
ncbi:MAG: homoserine dehydrogenase, partial [Candidatus Tectomicrobia bacterium]|nr:homoserine dehydrogenase [Candidatus Tectomicrobia bacterium]